MRHACVSNVYIENIIDNIHICEYTYEYNRLAFMYMDKLVSGLSAVAEMMQTKCYSKTLWYMTQIYI